MVLLTSRQHIQARSQSDTAISNGPYALFRVLFWRGIVEIFRQDVIWSTIPDSVTNGRPATRQTLVPCGA